MTTTQSTDFDLIRRIQASDEKAMAVLYKKYKAKLVPFIAKRGIPYDEIPDVIQAIMIKFWNTRHTIKLVNCSGFIMQMAVNESINHWRKHQRSYETTDTFDTAVQKFACQPKINNLIQDDIDASFERLTPQYRKLFKLWLKGYTEQEMAKLCDIPCGTVKSMLFRAKAHLKTDLAKRRWRTKLHKEPWY